jgi:microcystin-dependent protein
VTPEGNAYARVIGATPYQPPASAPLAAMAPEALAPAGGDQPHNNMMPYLTFYFCIALQGVFPPRT